jgi:hypothetical protein
MYKVVRNIKDSSINFVLEYSFIGDNLLANEFKHNTSSTIKNFLRNKTYADDSHSISSTTGVETVEKFIRNALDGRDLGSKELCNAVVNTKFNIDIDRTYEYIFFNNDEYVYLFLEPITSTTWFGLFSRTFIKIEIIIASYLIN